MVDEQKDRHEEPISPERRLSSVSLASGFSEKSGHASLQQSKSRTAKLEETADWGTLRRKCYWLLRNQWFEAIVSTLVFSNLVLIIYEADYEAQCYPKYFDDYESCPFRSSEIVWVRTCNLVLLNVYTFEAILRIFVFRRQFPFSSWNQLDVLVCSTGWIGVIFTGSINLAFLRIFRVGRLARAFRFLFRIRELYLLLNGVLSSLKAIFFGTLLLMVLLVAYSIILVEWVHPTNTQIVYSSCSECTTAFRSVWWSTITLFKQVIAGDSWIVSYPLIEREPYMAFIIMTVVVTVSLGMINLILTVIVERAAEAREKDIAENVKQKQMAQDGLKQDLLKICAEMDNDGDGQLSAQELRWAYENNEAFRNIMMTLDIRYSDLESVFKILDSDGTGELEYHEFCDELIQLQGQDIRVMVAMTRSSVHEIRSMVQKLDQRLHKYVPTDKQKQLHAEQQERWRQSLDAKINYMMTRWQEHPVSNEQAVTDLRQSSESMLASSNASTVGSTHAHLSASVLTDVPSLALKPEEVMYNADEQVSIVVRLQKELQNLALAEADVLHEAQNQVASLLSQVELTGSLVDALREKCPHQCLQMISVVVEEIKYGTSFELAGAVQALKLRIQDTQKVVDRQDRWFRKIQELIPQNLLEISSADTCAAIDVVHPISRM